MAPRRWLLTVPALLGALGAGLEDGPVLRGEVVTDGALADRVSRAPADLVVYIGGEQRGSLETCGCPHRPRGSLARLVAYVTASRAATDAPSLLLNPGRWLEDPAGYGGALLPESVAKDGWMVRGLTATGWDALNVTPSDAAGLAALDPGLARALPLVSASVEGPGVARWRIVERGGRRIGVTGIAADELTGAPIPGYTVRPPERARATISELASQVDLVILLEWRAAEAAKRIAEGEPKVAVVVDANDHTGQEAPFTVGSAVWVWSDFEALRVSELRLDLTSTPPLVTRALDRHIDLDPQVPDDRAVAALLRSAREDLDRGVADPNGLDAARSAVLAARYPSPSPFVLAGSSDPPHYVGAAVCAACHPDAATTWRTSSHAHALDALVDRQSAHNPRCVGCHVTGYGLGGYRGEAELAGVGCEACHGPGSGHAANPVTAGTTPYGALPDGAAACVACHTAETAPDFQFLSAWARIQHGR